VLWHSVTAWCCGIRRSSILSGFTHRMTDHEACLDYRPYRREPNTVYYGEPVMIRHAGHSSALLA
jgi:hypothetical protein